MWRRCIQLVWSWRLLIFWIHGHCETLNKIQGNEYEETHPTKIAFLLDGVFPTCPSNHLPMLSFFECGVCSLFQLQAWTNLDKQTKPNLQPNVLEAWTTQSGLSATVAHTCEDCTWSPKLLLAFASVCLFCFGICWCTGLAFQRRVRSVGKISLLPGLSCTKVRTYPLLSGWTRTFYRMTVTRFGQC